jgi:hypothetical protein
LNDCAGSVFFGKEYFLAGYRDSFGLVFARRNIRSLFLFQIDKVHMFAALNDKDPITQEQNWLGTQVGLPHAKGVLVG